MEMKQQTQELPEVTTDIKAQITTIKTNSRSHSASALSSPTLVTLPLAILKTAIPVKEERNKLVSMLTNGKGGNHCI